MTTKMNCIVRSVARCAVGALVAIAAGCGGADDSTEPLVADAAGGSDSGLDTASEAQAGGAGSGGADAGPDSFDTGSAGDANQEATGATTLSLPQFVRGAARVNTAEFGQIPLIIEVAGTTPDSVELSFDGKPPTAATADASRFVAIVDAKALGDGSHPLVVTASLAAKPSASIQGTLVVASASLQWTDFAKVGPAFNNHLFHDVDHDRIALSWTSMASGANHQTFLNYFDGAFQKLLADDLVLSAPSDSALSSWTAFGKDAIGVVYRTPKPNDPHWLIKMRIVDLDGKEKLPATELTTGGASFAYAQAGVDPGGFSATWLQITPPANPNDPLPPVELRYARYDMNAGKMVGPLTLDSDQPQPTGSTQGDLKLESLAELDIACNSDICLVSYTRDVYNSLVDLNIPKLHLAVVDLATGKLKAAPEAISGSDWDTQMFGQHLIALGDGTFTMVYTATDTAAALNPKSPCDETLERDLLYAVKFDASGAMIDAPAPIFDFEGTRQFPRLAPHPAGYALFWEDQRSECQANGHIRMSMNVTNSALSKLLDPYLEVPASIALPPEYPTLAVTGTNFLVSWSDNRHGNGMLDSKPEVFVDSYWRK